MSKLAVVDTADVFVKSKKTGKVFMTAEAQLTSLSQTLGINESIFGGIGSRKLFTFKGQKEVTTTIRNAFYDKNFLAMTQGVDVLEDDKAIVHKTEDLKVEQDEEALQVVIEGTPVGEDVHLRNKDGAVQTIKAVAGAVAIPEAFAEAGDIVTVAYQTEVTGDVIEIAADKFGEAFEVEYRTIGYDPNTNEVKVDIFIQLDNVVPNGEFELSLENGTAIAPEFTFDALAVQGNAIGRIIEVKRDK